MVQIQTIQTSTDSTSNTCCALQQVTRVLCKRGWLKYTIDHVPASIFRMGRENLNFRTMGARVTSPVLIFNLHEFFPRFGFLRRTFLDFPPETWGPCFRGENPAARLRKIRFSRSRFPVCATWYKWLIGTRIAPRPRNPMGLRFFRRINWNRPY